MKTSWPQNRFYSKCEGKLLRVLSWGVTRRDSHLKISLRLRAWNILLETGGGRSEWVWAELLSCVWLFVTPWTVAHQALLSIGRPVKRQQYERRLEWWWLGPGRQLWRWQSERPGVLLGELTRLVDGRSARYEGREKLMMNWDEKVSFTEKWRTCQFWTCYVIFGQLLTCLDIFPHL